MGKMVKCVIKNCGSNTTNKSYKICSSHQCGKPSGRGKCRQDKTTCRHSKSSASTKKKFTSSGSKFDGRVGGKRSGVIYGIAHPKFSGWVKLGYSIRGGKAIVQRYNVSCPDKKFNLVKEEWVSSRQKAEKDMKERAKELASEHKGEWFKISRPKAEKLIKKMGRKY